MSDDEGLLKAVCDFPDDDLPRLAYADWCDENGDPERADYVRLSLEAARTEPALRCDRCRAAEGSSGTTKTPCTCDPDYLVMKGRLRRAVTDKGRLWAGEPLNQIRGAGWYFRRGFVRSVHLTLAGWAAHGPALSGQHPIESAVATDLSPQGTDGRFYWDKWYGDGGYALSSSRHAFADLVRAIEEGVLHTTYETPALAHDRLSRALLGWVRERAREGP